MRAERRTQVLGGVLILVAAIAWWIYGSGGTPSAVTTAQRGAAAPGQQAAGAGQTPLDVHIEALSAERQGPEGTGRNPFEFRARSAPPPPPRPSSELQGIAPPPVPTGPPPPPPIALKFIGVVEKSDGVRVALLSDGKTPPMYGVVGQTLDGRYRIVTIGVESLELEHIDGRGKQTIRLTGQ